MRKLMLVLLVLGMALPIAYAGQGGQAGQAPAKVKVTVALANVRSAADAGADILLVARSGQTFEVTGKAANWYQIVLPDGRKAFINADVVAPVAGAPAPPVPPPARPPDAPSRSEPPTSASRPAALSPVEPFSMVLARAGLFLASHPAYKDVYGTGAVFGIELRIGKRALAGWLEATFRQATGKSTFTKEETKATIIGAEAGALYRFLTGRISAYAGAGLGYYSLSESNTFIGKASGGNVGFCALGGATYAVSSSIVADVRIKFSSGKMKPADFDINVGGLTVGLGVGLRI
jgi:hypothetical protein